MLSKGLIGALLITFALLLLAALRWLTGGGQKDSGSGDAKTFLMPHEFPEKAFIEKEVTEGMDGIPETLTPETSSSEADAYFTNRESENPSPPTDLF